MPTAKTLIRLGGCPGWSGSSLVAKPHCLFCHEAAHFLLNSAQDRQKRITFSACVRSSLFQFYCSILYPGQSYFQLVPFIYEPRHDKTYFREFPTRPDTNRPAQLQKLAWGLKFWLQKLETIHYLGSEQQWSASLFVRIWHKTRFLMARLI